VVDHRLAALFDVGLLCGLRRGELRDLRWSDYNADAKTIRVSRNRVAVGGGVAEVKPRNGQSRTVSVLASVVGSLKAWRARQARERLAFAGAAEPLRVHRLVGRPDPPDRRVARVRPGRRRRRCATSGRSIPSAIGSGLVDDDDQAVPVTDQRRQERQAQYVLVVVVDETTRIAQAVDARFHRARARPDIGT
jgi:hypothetical protein